ncbi:MAG: glycosyltransferase family 2 protein [Planctomycetaceae bacterium]|nr:glycosyltransferase family 2 protein [Planctomycetaceae bacterium]
MVTQIHIDPYLLTMPQVRSLTPDICDDETFFRSGPQVPEGPSWTLCWGTPTMKRRFGVAETGFFWDAMHIDTQGLYQFSSLNSEQGVRAIEEFTPPESALALLNTSTLPASKYRQPEQEVEWEGVVFACQNPTDRSIHSVASTEDWWRYYEACCRYYGSKLFVKLHPWNQVEVEQRVRAVAAKFGCEVGRVGHRVIENCDHVVLFNSTFAVDCMVRGVRVKQGAPGYFYQTGAVTYCGGDPRIPLRETRPRAQRLVEFLVWRYCFSMDCSLEDWRRRLRQFAESSELFPLHEEESYGAYLARRCKVRVTETPSSIIVRGNSICLRNSVGNEATNNQEIDSPAISFCTTCMGRLSYLCQTLPRNLEIVRHLYPSVELILLDYNSQDGLREWVKSAVWKDVESGLLTVYQTTDPVHYHSTHAKNLAHRLSRGRVVCNLDADNFLLPGYVDYLLRELERDPKQIFYGNGRNSTGRIALKREYFEGVGGYQEQMRGYGYDDVDLIHRAVNAFDLKRHPTDRFNSFIAHSHEERVQNMPFESIDDSNLMNRKIMERGLERGDYCINQESDWGAGVVVRNYTGPAISC